MSDHLYFLKQTMSHLSSKSLTFDRMVRMVVSSDKWGEQKSFVSANAVSIKQTRVRIEKEASFEKKVAFLALKTSW